MQIVVCVKQVPEITNVRVNPETGTLMREGVASILNPFCEYALDHAARLKAANPEIEVIAVSMGPPQAESALLRCLELGADRAVLVSDRKFAGADTWATALTLAAVIRTAAPGYDLILAGKQAIDGDTAQVGPEIAEILGLPQVMYGVEMSLTPNRKRIRVKREVESGHEVLEARLPALVSASKGEAHAAHAIARGRAGGAPERAQEDHGRGSRSLRVRAGARRVLHPGGESLPARAEKGRAQARRPRSG